MDSCNETYVSTGCQISSSQTGSLGLPAGGTGASAPRQDFALHVQSETVRDLFHCIFHTDTMAMDVASIAPGPDELSDDQITQLLHEATVRLEAKEKSLQLSSADGKVSLAYPKLDTGTVQNPLVSVRGGIASVDASKLLGPNLRKTAGEARKVEDPVTSKKLALEVRIAPSIVLSLTCNEEDIPNTLEQFLGAVLVASLRY